MTAHILRSAFAVGMAVPLLRGVAQVHDGFADSQSGRDCGTLMAAKGTKRTKNAPGHQSGGLSGNPGRLGRPATPSGDLVPSEPLPLWLTEAMAAIRDRLQRAGISAIEQYLFQGAPSDLYGQLGLEDDETRLRATLDLVQHQLQENPGLRAEFERHALMQRYVRLPSEDERRDIVAEEIAAEVTIRWADRKSPEYKNKPWASRPDLFIMHVYKKWYDTSMLRHRHIGQDKNLYSAYNTMVFRHPERDLNLPREPRQIYDTSAEISRSRPGYVRIPTSSLSEPDKALRRAQEARYKRTFLAKKREP